LKNKKEMEHQDKTNEQRTIRVLMSGGGTGGHIFPAVAIANEIKSRFPNAEFLFVGANGKMEMEKSWPLIKMVW